MENEQFLTSQIITYLGNKRTFLQDLDIVITNIKGQLHKDKLKIGDLFSGSGIVARNFKKDAELLITNDMEYYSWMLNECYLSNLNKELVDKINYWYNYLIQAVDVNKTDGFVYQLYAPKDMNNIQLGERCFYTSYNAKYIDSMRGLINNVPVELQKFFIAPLLTEASIKTNTSGVFKGFYKDKKTGIGRFGGLHEDALSRITKNIELPKPIFSNFNCEVINYNEDIFNIIDKLPELDVIYLDPPYNQHPYGSNYFMLNLIAKGVAPQEYSKISGIPKDWNRSVFNVKKKSLSAMLNLCSRLNTKYLIISFSDDGFITKEEMVNMLSKLGSIEIREKQYNTFRGSRNLKDRTIHIKEYLYIVKKI